MREQAKSGAIIKYLDEEVKTAFSHISHFQGLNQSCAPAHPWHAPPKSDHVRATSINVFALHTYSTM